MVAASHSRSGLAMRRLQLAGWFPTGAPVDERQDCSVSEKENAVNTTTRLGGELGIVLCGALLLAPTGCLLPGMRGGPPRLPGLPGGPKVEPTNPSGVSLVTTGGEDLGRNDAPQIVQNESQ
jgi:hypothetical protein